MIAAQLVIEESASSLLCVEQKKRQKCHGQPQLLRAQHRINYENRNERTKERNFSHDKTIVGDDKIWADAHIIVHVIFTQFVSTRDRTNI
jgi:hypothetical protein